MDVSVADIVFWISDHKWWIIALIPIALVLMVMRTRGERGCASGHVLTPTTNRGIFRYEV